MVGYLAFHGVTNPPATLSNLKPLYTARIASPPLALGSCLASLGCRHGDDHLRYLFCGSLYHLQRIS